MNITNKLPKPTSSEILILKTLSNFENEVEEKALAKYCHIELSSVSLLQQFKNALEGCVVKCFAEKSECDGNIFYKITKSGLKQI